MLPDYKQMYFLLFNEITDTAERLQKVQQQVEELYICAQEPLYLSDRWESSSDDSV